MTSFGDERGGASPQSRSKPVPTRPTHLPYTPLLLASPVIAVASWAAAGLGLAWWIWRHAPLIDDRPNP